MDDWQDTWITLFAYLALAALGGALLALLCGLASNMARPWLRLQRIRQISWLGLDVFVVLLLIQIVPLMVDECLHKAGFFDWLYGESAAPSMSGRQFLWSELLAIPLIVVMILVGLRQLRGTRPTELGLTGVRAGPVFGFGYVAWLILTPATIFVQWLAVLVTPSEWIKTHDIFLVGEQPLAGSEWVVLVLLVTVMVPIIEELVFRGLLLGWQLHRGWDAQAILALCMLFMAVKAGDREDSHTYNPAPIIYVITMLSGIILVPFLRLWTTSFKANLPALPSSAASGVEENTKQATANPSAEEFKNEVAIYINALFFAMMHASIWPTPIPLFVLGVGLAWTAYRTSSLVGAITLHGLFNGVSALALLWKRVYFS